MDNSHVRGHPHSSPPARCDAATHSHRSTPIHAARAQVVAWQIHGQKRFSGLREPSAWAPKALRLTHTPGELVKPPQLSDNDTLSEVMGPGR